MNLSTETCLSAIESHSRGLAESARGNLAAPVERCPGWSVGDLVWHVSDVHWFWGTIAQQRLHEPPEEEQHPARVPDDQLIGGFLTGAARMIDVLHAADQATPVWTWYPGRQDIGFITRHQVQEAAVHHWDAAQAAGTTWSVEPGVAADCVEEYLTCSLADADDVARLGGASTLPGELTLAATDTGQSWTVSQADPTAAHLWRPGSGGPTVSGTAAELLLWLYRRIELPVSAPELVAALRGESDPG